MTPRTSSTARVVAHASGAMGMLVVLLFGLGLSVPPSLEFPDSLLGSFHTFFVGALVGDDDPLPEANTPDWKQDLRAGDVLFMSKGRTPWGMWTHVAVVVRAPEDQPRDTRWVQPGELAVLNSSIHSGMYLAPLDEFDDWPRIVRRRATEDVVVGERIGRAALTHLDRVFAGVTLGRAPYSNCTRAAVEALRTEEFDPEMSGWWVPDELWRSSVWVE